MKSVNGARSQSEFNPSVTRRSHSRGLGSASRRVFMPPEVDLSLFWALSESREWILSRISGCLSQPMLNSPEPPFPGKDADSLTSSELPSLPSLSKCSHESKKSLLRWKYAVIDELGMKIMARKRGPQLGNRNRPLTIILAASPGSLWLIRTDEDECLESLFLQLLYPSKAWASPSFSRPLPGTAWSAGEWPSRARRPRSRRVCGPPEPRGRSLRYPS